MNSSRKKVIRQIIETRINELQRIVTSAAQGDETRSAQLQDEATRADALANISVDSLLLARAEDDLRLLQRQLERIGQDDFGLCRLCAAEIAANRIASVPATRLCIACAQQQEKNT